MELKHKCIQHTRRETDQSTVITSQLSKLANDIGEFVDFDDVEPRTLSSYHKSILDIMYHEAVISLNRPITTLVQLALAILHVVGRWHAQSYEILLTRPPTSGLCG
jgi:hypothetical protein